MLTIINFIYYHIHLNHKLQLQYEKYHHEQILPNYHSRLTLFIINGEISIHIQNMQQLECNPLCKYFNLCTISKIS